MISINWTLVVGIGENGGKRGLGMLMRLVMYGLGHARHVHLRVLSGMGMGMWRSFLFFSFLCGLFGGGGGMFVCACTDEGVILGNVIK